MHHGQPDGVLQVVFVARECLCSVKRRINVDQLHLSHILLGQFGHSSEGL